METILTIHGLVRWVVAALAVIIVVKFAYGWLAKKAYQPLDRSLLTAYTIVLDINVLMGIALLIWRGFGPIQMEHATTMLLAAIAAHMTALWRKSDDSAKKYRNQMFMVLLSLVLILAGVIRLRGGFFF